MEKALCSKRITDNIDKRNKEFISFCLIICLLFLLNPLSSILLTAVFAIVRRDYRYVKPLIILLVLYLSALNTTKYPDGDMVDYLDMYNSVPYNGYLETLKYTSYGLNTIKDAGYGTLVYILYYLFSGNEKLFIFTTTLLIYIFVFASIFKINSDYKLPCYLIVSELLVLAFFTQFFSLSAHIIRQELATSFFIYALAYRTSSKIRFIIWCLIAFLFHSSTIVIIAIACVSIIIRPLKIYEIGLFIAFAATFVGLFAFIGDFILSRFGLGGLLASNVEIMSSMSGSEDTSGDANRIIASFFSAIVLIVSLVEIFRKDKCLYPVITNICFIWSALVLSLSVAPLIQYRFFFIIYSLMPFVLFIFFRKVPILLKMCCFCVVIFLIIRFYISLNSGVFQYASVEQALLDPFFMLIKLS